MKFTETSLRGAYIVETQCVPDARGFFGRVWCEEELKTNELDSKLAQCSISFNRRAGTLRGMHLQLPPFAETKLVRCIRGALFDVIIDLRTDSGSFGRWVGVELTAENRRALYVPKGFAHGFITLQDNSEVLYMISEVYAPQYARGIRWDDPQFGIAWPATVEIISDKDRSYPAYDPAEFPLSSADTFVR